MAPTAQSSPQAGAWMTKWLSPPRHAVYLFAARHHQGRALGLYEWNAHVSAALMRDLAHLEVGLRNAYDRAIVQQWNAPWHWTRSPRLVLPPVHRTRGGRRIDINERSRDGLVAACRRAGPGAPTGKVIAEPPFGFWRYLSSAASEKTLWVPYLHNAFPPGTDRRVDVDEPVTRLHRLRNRVAHHEPLLNEDLDAHARAIVRLSTLILPSLGKHIAATSTVAAIVSRRPCP